MATIIAVTNQKGGVAKTTTTLCLGSGLAEQGYRVLLIDLDPQGSLSIYVIWEIWCWKNQTGKINLLFNKR